MLRASQATCRWGLVVGTGLAIVGGGVSGCSRSHAPPDTATKAAASAVDKYYEHRFIGGGWWVLNIHGEGHDVVGELFMSSNEQACGILREGTGDREEAVSLACPRSGDSIWNVIGSDRDIILQVSCDGRVDYEHSCRQAHRSGTSQ